MKFGIDVGMSGRTLTFFLKRKMQKHVYYVSSVNPPLDLLITISHKHSIYPFWNICVTEFLTIVINLPFSLMEVRHNM